jgi:ribonuclease HI
MVDGEIRRHNTWPDCNARVRGAQGARFRKTFSPEDEAALVSSWEADGGQKSW